MLLSPAAVNNRTRDRSQLWTIVLQVLHLDGCADYFPPLLCSSQNHVDLSHALFCRRCLRKFATPERLPHKRRNMSHALTLRPSNTCLAAGSASSTTVTPPTRAPPPGRQGFDGPMCAPRVSSTSLSRQIVSGYANKLAPLPGEQLRSRPWKPGKPALLPRRSLEQPTNYLHTLPD